jgi:hypothetical protein
MRRHSGGTNKKIGAANGDGDRFVGDELQALDDRKAKQRVRSHQGSDQNRCQPSVARAETDCGAHNQGNGKRQEAKRQRAAASPAKLTEIDLQAGEEHQQQLADLREKLRFRPEAGEGNDQKDQCDLHILGIPRSVDQPPCCRAQADEDCHDEDGQFANLQANAHPRHRETAPWFRGAA